MDSERGDKHGEADAMKKEQLQLEQKRIQDTLGERNEMYYWTAAVDRN